MISSRSKLARFWDGAAKYVITFGGLLIILSVAGMMLIIAQVALPLFYTPAPKPVGKPLISAIVDRALAAGVDESGQMAWLLLPKGEIEFIDLHSEQILTTSALQSPTGSKSEILRATLLANQQISLQWSDGAQSLEQINLTRELARGGKEKIQQLLKRIGQFGPEPGAVPPRLSIMRGEDGNLTRVSYLSDGRLHVSRQSMAEDFMGEKTSDTKALWITDKLPAALTALMLDHSGSTLYAGSERGDLLRWDLNDHETGARLLDSIRIQEDQRAITALAMVLGEISIAVGDQRGGLTTWFAVPTSLHGGKTALQRIHTLKAHQSAVIQIIPAQRTKALLSLDEQGSLQSDHMTSGRNLFTLVGEPVPTRFAALGPRDSSVAAIGGDGGLRVWRINIPHPEISWRTLFGKVWYEGYREPVIAWQSSSASDDFEPKLSLVPLIFGTLKGTFYALIFAVPLSIFGALYTSQFMRPSVRNVVKPAIEIMAAIPSVVIGFLAALWLAPKVENGMGSLFLSILMIPAALIFTLLLLQKYMQRPKFARLSRGAEFLLLIPGICLGFLIAAYLGPFIESHLFGRSFGQWFFNATGHRYDQRNSIIIAFALGFAVIPIVFTIADDSMSNIPRSLSAASLALGASRWQTAWRIVLPSASPGIFAGVMIGFGRAVGETMIVLMATGNTPIIDWSPFNGMRTLSANIAVEIAEAPVNGTLYRVLFLTAVLLFLMTFAVNTAAELVRQRLRRKYGQL